MYTSFTWSVSCGGQISHSGIYAFIEHTLQPVMSQGADKIREFKIFYSSRVKFFDKDTDFAKQDVNGYGDRIQCTALSFSTLSFFSH